MENWKKDRITSCERGENPTLMVKMRNFLIRYKTFIFILIFCIVGVFIIPPITHWFVKLKGSLGFITLENESVWIGFIGTIIGGMLTLLGVSWTIQHERAQMRKERELRDKEIKEERSIQFKPILSFDYIEKKKSEDDFQKDTSDSEVIKFKLKNCGRGEAQDIIIDVESSNALDDSYELKLGNSKFDYTKDKLSILNKSESVEFNLYLCRKFLSNQVKSLIGVDFDVNSPENEIIGSLLEQNKKRMEAEKIGYSCQFDFIFQYKDLNEKQLKTKTSVLVRFFTHDDPSNWGYLASYSLYDIDVQILSSSYEGIH